MAKIPPSQQRQILKNAARTARSQGSRVGGFLRRLGPIGALIQALADALSGGRGRTQGPSQADMDQARRMLEGSGFEVRPAGEPQSPPIQSPGRRPNVPEPPVIKPVETPRRRRSEPDGPAESIQMLPTRIRGAMESISSDITGFSPWVLVNSSNVYAVAFDEQEGQLYVQFRADAAPIGFKDSVSICSGKSYKVAIRPATPGPIYSYGSKGRPVPKSVFDALISTRSPGKVVWDRLRECGSTWQHKYQYSLVDVPAGQGVPRKATRRGFRVRNVPTVGMGRRGSRRSTLPESVGRIRQ